MNPQSLVEVLDQRAKRNPDATAFAFLENGETVRERLTYAQLDAQARTIGATLQQLTQPGDRALLLYPPGLSFVTAFLGCQYAGVVAVPSLPPDLNRVQTTVERVATIARDADPAIVLTTSELLRPLKTPATSRGELGAALWQATDNLPRGRAALWKKPRLDGSELSFLQYTSGSTSVPKGVMVTHENVLANLAMLRETAGIEGQYNMVSWLPLFHDMGLIGIMLHGLYVGGETQLMSPLSFLKKPIRWLRAISQQRNVFSGGPNFAFDLCVERITEAQKRELDLSQWQIAFNGSETVRADTLERFYEAFKECGFRREAWLPCYGLAEATLVVSARTPGREYQVRNLDKGALEQGRAESNVMNAVAGVDAVSCGNTKLEQGIAIVDPDTCVVRSERQVGEVWVKGANVAAGYWRQSKATHETFMASTLDGEGPYLRTGDLGFMEGGELFVTGRIKELILVRGRCLYPHDIEQMVTSMGPRFPEVCSNECVAVAIPGEDRERIGLVVQINPRKNPEHDPVRLVGALQERLLAEFEVGFSEVVLVQSAIPRTSSGKKMRRACGRLLADGIESSMKVVYHWRRAAADAVEIEIESEEQPGLAGLTGRRVLKDDKTNEILALIVQWLACEERLDPRHIEPTRSLADFGLDSLAGVSLIGYLENELNVSISLDQLEQQRTLAELARYCASR